VKRDRVPQSEVHREHFEATNSLGAETFGTLWLAATEEAVKMFRANGLGDEVELDYRIRASISASLYRALSLAIRHPNNLARGADRIAARRQLDESAGGRA
jgi:hypothetical protein